MDLVSGMQIILRNGPFQGQPVIITSLDDYGILAELIVFGRKTPIELSRTDLGLEEKPLQLAMPFLIREFDELYQRLAPMRYEQLQSGYERRI